MSGVQIVRGFPIYAAMRRPQSALAYTVGQVTRRAFLPLVRQAIDRPGTALLKTLVSTRTQR